MHIAKEFKENLESITKHLKEIEPKCPICKNELGLGYATSLGLICDICYFDNWDKEIEKHPIDIPRNTPRY
jgi:hypothetical protein